MPAAVHSLPAGRRGAVEPLLSLRGVVKRYREGGQELTVLDGVSFELAAGAGAGVYGARRAGKSTLLRLVAGIEAPDAGAIVFAGRDLTALSAAGRARLLRGDLALLCAGGWLASPGETVLDHVAVALGSLGMTLAQARRRALETLDAVGVAGLGGERARSLGCYERARVMLARALAREPRLLLVDEPAPLPSVSDREAFCALLRALAHERGFALLVASESLSALSGLQALMSLSAGELCASERGPYAATATATDADAGMDARAGTVFELRPRRAGASP